MPKSILALCFVLAMANWKISFSRIPRLMWGFVAFLGAELSRGLFLDPFLQSDFLLLFGRMIEMLLLFWLSYNLFLDDHRLLRRSMAAYAVSCVLLSTLLASGVLAEDYQNTGRASTFGTNPNTVGGLLALGFTILAAYLLASRRWWLRTGAVPAMVLVGKAILETGSRGAMVTAFVGLAVCALFSLIQGTVLQRAASLLVMMAIVVVATAAITRSELVYNRWQAAIHNPDLGGRQEIYPAALGMMIERPLFGWGPVSSLYELNDRAMYAEYMYRVGGTRGAHNMILGMLLDVGVVGTLPYLITIWIILRRAYHARYLTGNVLPLALFLCVMVINMSDDWQILSAQWLVFAIAAASAEIKTGAFQRS
ncbi:MAG TPA: O-antigen ligase family protein [Terracidiphilus sp.]